MGNEKSAWDKAIDAMESIGVRVAGKLGGPDAANHERQAAEDLRQGHLVNASANGIKVMGDELKHGYNAYTELGIHVAGKLGGPDAAKHQGQLIEAFNHGHMIEAAKLGLKVTGDEIAYANNASDRLGVHLTEKIGGPSAARHEKQAIEARNKGNIIEGVKLGFQAEGDIIAHVTGHDKPLETPPAQHPAPAAKGRS